MVFQRNAANEAAVLVAGMAPPASTLVEARFVPLSVGEGNTTAWTALQLIPGSTAFTGSVTVSAGWYRLDIRAKANATITGQTQVNRVGVGEVFVIAGQSNVFGYIQRVDGSADDRVSCIDFQQDSLSEQLLPLQFSHPTAGSSIGPSQPPHLWSMLGDKLVKRLNVPVLFLGAALGGSSSTEWKQGAAGNLGTTTNSAVYRRLGEVLLNYVSRTGARAVLWHQGETDTYNGVDGQTYYNNLQYIIQKSRQQLNENPIAWMVSRVSYNGGQTSPGIIAAQNQIISNLPNTFPGPASDSIIGPENRPDNIHMKGPGLIRFINSWDQALSATFFEQAVPIGPTSATALITSGYTMPLIHRQGDVVALASLRNNPHDNSSQYVAQLVRASDGTVVYESLPSLANPVLATIPTNLPDGQYQFRIQSTHPVITGTLSEPFTIRQSAPASALLPIIQKPIQGGVAPAALKRFTYSYEPDSHGFFSLIESSMPVEIRLERIDGGSFSDAGWHLAPPASQAPDYPHFAEFNYILNYPPVAFGKGGVEPGIYRYSVRTQGDTGQGLWYDLLFIGGRVILYQNETIPPIPPILSINSLSAPCLSGPMQVTVSVSEGSLTDGSLLSIRLSDSDGSFANETTIGSSTSSPVTATLPANLPPGNHYRIRVVASSPSVPSAPSEPFSICNRADLSVVMSLNTRTPRLDSAITVNLVLTNDGPNATGNVQIQSLLPTGMEFMDSPLPSVSATKNTVTINAGTVNTGSQLPFVFRIKAIQPGSYAIAAQVTTSSQGDPDSQPNSGTGDGQDDAAMVDLRTPNAGSQFYASPNPNQVPLPPVQSSQPPVNPDQADLSLSISASNLVVGLGKEVDLTVSVFNGGGAAANNVLVQSILPPGWQLISTNGLTVNGQTVQGGFGSIPAGQYANLVLHLRVSGIGTLHAQIMTSAPQDPDSTPGNGYINGEDDEATLMIRVR